MKTAVTYARFSSARQHETSIEAQRDAMAKWCAQRSVRIVQEYADRAASGTKTEGRDDFLQMLADLKQRRVDYVLVHKYDRFARNENDQYFYMAMIEQRGAKLVAVAQEFGDGPESDAATFLADPSMRRVRDMKASREWIYGRTPVFDAEIGHRFDWGELQIGMTVERGVITECRVFSDALDADYIAHLADLFPGAAPDGASLAACVRDSRSAMAASETGDILSWLESAGSGLI